MSDPKDVLEPVNPQARALLEQLRSGAEPPVGAEARVLKGVESVASPGPLGGSGTALVVGGTLAVAGIVVALLILSGPRETEREQVVPEETTAPSATVEPSTIEPPTAPKPEPKAEPAAVEPEPEPAAQDEDEAKGSARTPSKTQDPLERELELIGQAKQASAAGHHRKAIRLLREHREEFKNGVLVAERDAAMVLARCGAGEVEKAKKAARAFVREHAGSHLVERLRGSCAGPALATQKSADK